MDADGKDTDDDLQAQIDIAFLAFAQAPRQERRAAWERVDSLKKRRDAAVVERLEAERLRACGLDPSNR